MTITKRKLSDLSGDVLLCREGYWHVYTVADLIAEIQKLGGDHHMHDDWFIVTPTVWEPSAEDMIEEYLENTYQNMYESWLEKANDCVTGEIIAKIQKILDEAFTDDVKEYYEFGEPVEIDLCKDGLDDLIQDIHCPNCHTGVFVGEREKAVCNHCSYALNRGVVKDILKAAYTVYKSKKDRKFIVIENKENEEQFLLSLPDFLKHNVPAGHVKRTSVCPLSEEYWETVKHLPVYLFVDTKKHSEEVAR